MYHISPYNLSASRMLHQVVLGLSTFNNALHITVITECQVPTDILISAITYSCYLPNDS